MKTISIFMVAILGCLTTAGQSQPHTSLTAKTEAPVLLDKNERVLNIQIPMREKEFNESSAKFSKNPIFIGIKRKPAKLTADALFGFDIVLQEKNISWILDGNENNGYVLYADFNADGDLTNDKPLKFKEMNGEHTYELHKTLTELIGERKYTYDLRFEVWKFTQPGETEEQTALKIQDGTRRIGKLSINNRQMAFALSGRRRNYSGDSNSLYFDFDGDGKFDTKTAYSLEAYKIKDRYVNIGDRSYEFTVDRYGDTLTLKPLAEKMPDRADLRVGSSAPDFSFKDLNGDLRQLQDFRGKVVLIDVWGIWCAPCVTEAPKLAEIYRKLKDKGFEIVSLNEGDKVESLQTFIAKNQMNWTHTKTDKTFAMLYRVDRYPTYFLLDKDGKIVSNTLRAGEEMYEKIEAMLGN